MNNYPALIKKRLSAIIKEMAESPELFVKNPGKDFTRERKLSFETVVQYLPYFAQQVIYHSDLVLNKCLKKIIQWLR